LTLFQQESFFKYKRQEEIILEAEKNKRKYSRQRAKNIPINLGELFLSSDLS
jgi:hypothetical protein